MNFIHISAMWGGLGWVYLKRNTYSYKFVSSLLHESILVKFFYISISYFYPTHVFLIVFTLSSQSSWICIICPILFSIPLILNSNAPVSISIKVLKIRPIIKSVKILVQRFISSTYSIGVYIYIYIYMKNKIIHIKVKI